MSGNRDNEGLKEKLARLQLRRSALYLALAAGLSASPMAFSQGEEDAEEEVTDIEDVIVVTGFRSAVERAISTKRQESSVVEAVYAEDIGKLPDVSIAEALARMPGLTAQRTDGRSQTISIRGLGPDFGTAMLNGREQVTTGDNRGVEFDQYPSELLGSVVVYKTPDATLIGQGLAGTVDMRTIRPLSAGESVFSLNARYEWNEDSAFNPDGSSDGYRASAIYIDQFDDNTFGVTFGAAFQSTPNQVERFEAWGFPDIGDGETLVPGGAKPFVQSNELERFGMLGTLEYAPNDAFSTTLDVSYSDFKERQILRGIEFPLFWSAAQLQDGFTVDDGLITDGVFEDVHGVMRSDRNDRSAELFNAGWNVRYELGQRWGMETDISYSRAEREDVLLESYAGTGPTLSGAPDTLGFSIAPSGVVQFAPSLDYADPNQFVLTDPQGWGAGADPDPLTQAGFINNPDTTDWLGRARLQLDRAFDAGPFSQGLVGVDFGRRDKSRSIGQSFLVPPGGADSADIPEGAMVGTTPLDFIGIPGMISWNPGDLVDNVYQQVPVELSSFAVPQDWNVREDVFTTFLKLNIDTLMGDMPVTGNVGVQAVHTDQTASGFRVAGAEVGAGVAEGSFIPVEDGDDYWRILPSLNLRIDVADNQVVRLGASRVMARPRMDQLNASLALNTDFTALESTDPQQSFFSAGGGNPALRPTLADTLDLTWERYFADDSGYIALAGYYKDLSDFINPNDSFMTDFSAFIDDFLTPEQAAQLGTPLGLTSGPTNRGSGYIRGAEFTTALQASRFSPALDGFGAVFSVSYTDSSVRLGDSEESIDVPGLSDWVVNTTLFYERNGFEARVSHRYRDEFLSEVFGLSATRVTRSALSESIFDAQVSYEFDRGAFQGVSVFLQGNNLTNEPFTTFEGDDQRQVIDRQRFGRNFMLGASYRF
ncbi:TonB-dependent receptor [Wenzhouxiangella sp. AB-CW3]|nr:TonB-dependent receptor [Wenzhouxiangella sp. AB-CW3]